MKKQNKKLKKEYRKGEKVFDKIYPFLMILYFPLLLLPNSINKMFLALSRGIPGFIGVGIRYVLVKRLAKKCGRNVAIFPSVYFIEIENLVIGSHISIREACYIDGDNLEIGDNVMISHSSSIVTGAHYYDENIPMRDLLEDRHVKIGNNVWIGAGARILGSVNIGDNVIISANSVVSKSIKSNVVVGGVPARVLKPIS